MVGQLEDGREAAAAAGGRQDSARRDDAAGGRGGITPGAVAALLLTFVALVPVLIVVVTRTGRDYLPVQDLGYIDLRVRDVWSRDIPLVGPYSRGFNHPGPLFFWLIGIPAGLFGSPAWATLVGGALLHGVAIAASARVAWRRGGLPVLLAVLLAVHLSYPGGYLFLHHWNPHVALPFLALYLLLLWSASLGEKRSLVWAVAVGTFLVQSHVGYLLLVGVTAVWTALVVARDAGGLRAGLRSWARPLRRSAIVGTVLWLPVVVEQALPGRRGNLTDIWEYFTGSDEPATGLRRAAGLFATEFRVPPPWLGGEEATAALTGEVLTSSLAWLLVPAVLLVVAWWCHRRSSQRDAGRLAALLVVASATGIAAMAGVRGDALAYLFEWKRQLATLLVAALVLLIASALRLERARMTWGVAGVVLGLLLVVEVGGTAREVARHPRGRVLPFEPLAAEALGLIEQRGLPTEPVLIRGSGLSGLMEGVLDELDRHGVPVRVDETWAYKWGDRRAVPADEVSEVWYVVQDGHLTSDLTGRPGGEVIFRTTPLPPAEEEELVRLQRRLDEQLREAGRPELVGYLSSSLIPFLVEGVEGLDKADLDRVGELNSKVEQVQDQACRCSVVAFPASAADELAAEVGLYRIALEER